MNRLDFEELSEYIQKWVRIMGTEINIDEIDLETDPLIRDMFNSIGWTIKEYHAEGKRREAARYNALTEGQKTIEDAKAEVYEQKIIKMLLDEGITREEIDAAIKKCGSLTKDKFI